MNTIRIPAAAIRKILVLVLIVLLAVAVIGFRGGLQADAAGRIWLPVILQQTPTAAPGVYKVIGWNDLGMHCLNRDFQNLAVLPPFNTLYAEVIKQGAKPQLITTGVTVEYRIEGNTYSAGKTNFWQYAQKLFNLAAPLPLDTGLFGAHLSGNMAPETGFFRIEGVPMVPFSDAAPTVEAPYQIAHLTVKDAGSGQILAETRPVAPASTEMHCERCHSDGQRQNIATGNVETNILTLHDMNVKSVSLMTSRPVLCASCHSSNALGTAGTPGVPNLSLAMHGRHSNEFATPNTMEDTCYACHPGQQTKCLRDVMFNSDDRVTCIQCHGGLVALADPVRRPWIDEPRCGTCHDPQFAEEAGKRYRDSKGHGGLFCETCHGSPHAILPSSQPNDNIQNIALQGHAGTLSDCGVCHGPNVPSGPGPHQSQ